LQNILVVHLHEVKESFRRRVPGISEYSPYRGMETHSESHINPERAAGGKSGCRLITLLVDQLSPHPSYVKHQLSVSTSQLTALSALGELAFEQPIIVTQTGIVIDGYARWELARKQGRQSMLCLEYQFSVEEALHRLIVSHHPSKGFTGYCRSVLALELEPLLRERARLNQQIGGQKKAASDLTEAQKVDARSEMAAIANVSTGSLRKAKQVAFNSDPIIHGAAKLGEISVHRAWQWSHLSNNRQREQLDQFRSCRGVGVVSRRLIQKHVAKIAPTELIPRTLGGALKALVPDRIAVLDAIVFSEINAPGRVAYFTKDAIECLENKGGRPQCKTAIC
jgi:hypothetical protein